MKKSRGASFEPSEIRSYIRVNSLAQIGSTAVYARCAAQDASGEELRKQTAAALAVVAEYDLTVEDKNIIAEYGSADDMTRRPGLATLLGKIERGEVKTLVVRSLDRLARNSSDAGSLLRMFTENGVQVITANDGVG